MFSKATLFSHHEVTFQEHCFFKKRKRRKISFSVENGCEKSYKHLIEILVRCIKRNNKKEKTTDRK